MDLKKNNKIEDQEIENLVDYIDDFMSRKIAGHINITVNAKVSINKDELFIDST